MKKDLCHYTVPPKPFIKSIEDGVLLIVGFNEAIEVELGDLTDEDISITITSPS